MAQNPGPGPGDRFENGPYNLLSLDGGGIRGVSELVILDKIMRRVQEREGLDRIPKPCEYFHLMGGTSTGGLIAIMLGRLRMSTTDALAEYNNFARKIFRKKNRQFSVSSQFREATLESIVRDVAEKYAPGSSELMRDPNRTPRSWMGRAFVCARPSKDQDRGPLRIRAYPSDDDWAKDCKIWEAARATTAAPLYFKSISITSGDVTEEFIDPALGCNNPVAEVLDEAGEILDASCKLGCVLSLGTGTRPKSLEKAKGIGRNLQLFKLLKDYTTDSERTHSEMLRRFTDFPSTYFRFSVPGAAAKIGMAKHKKIGELTQMTRDYVESSAVAAEIEKIVDILCEGKAEGVTVGHVRYPNKNQIIMDKRRANTGGVASTLFTGRTEILDKLSAFFPKREGNTGPRREFLLYGMGGVGKTQIALKFKQMMESEKRFDRLMWVDATDSTTIEECYNVIAPTLPNGGGTKGTGTNRALHWMGTTSEEWLLIMDNRNDEDQPLAKFLPSTDKGNIIYTARPDHLKQMLPREAAAEVDKMEEQEAITMLLRATRQPVDDPSLREMSLPIVQELGCLPLALDQAGAYMYMDNCYLGDYLDLFLKQKESLLRKPPYKGSNEHNLPVYATFDLSHKVLVSYAKGKRGLDTAEKAKLALKILNFICFYHYQGIMEETVRRAAENRITSPHLPNKDLGDGRFSLEDVVRIERGEKWNCEPFRKAVRLLESLSIVKCSIEKRDLSRYISMHVLVHSWARDRMAEDERSSFSRCARTILYDSILHEDVPATHLYRRRVAPHLRTCDQLVEHRYDDNVENKYTAKRAAVAENVGGLEEVVQLWEEAVRERTLLNNPDDQGVLLFSFALASAYMRVGQWVKAEALAIEILKRANEAFPEKDSFFADVHGLLSRLYYEIGYKDESVEYQRTRIQLIKEEGDSKRLGYVSLLEEIHADLHHVDVVPPPRLSKEEAALKPSEAEIWDQYEEDLYIHGPDGEHTLATLQQLADNMREAHRETCAWLVAETYIKRCWERYGPNHPLVRSGLELLAKAYIRDGFAKKAILTQRQNVELHRAQCGSRETSFHTENQNKALDAIESWPKLAVENIRIWMSGGPRRNLSKALETFIQVFRDSMYSSICYTQPCGQTGHSELISRLGIEEEYPQGVVITPGDIGAPEIGLLEDDLLLTN